MAALISGVHRRLKSSETPWKEKLKLGRMAWKSRRVVLPRREQVLLDWAATTLIQHYANKYTLEEPILREMWLFLEDILESTRLKSLAQSGSIFLNSSFNQVFSATLSSACQPKTTQIDFIPTVLHCMEAILAQPTLAAILLSRYDTCVEMLRPMLCLAIQLSNATILESLPALLSLLVTVLQKCTSLQRQQHRHTKVFHSVCEELLAPAVCCCWVLKNHVDHSKVPSSTTSDVIVRIQEHLQQSLFAREHAAAFEKHLCDTKDSQTPGYKGVELLFQQLDLLMKNKGDANMSKTCALPAGGMEDAVLQYLPVAFNSFLTSPACADTSRTGFAMLQTLCGLALPLPVENDAETEDLRGEDSMDVDVDDDKGEVVGTAQEERLIATRDLLQTALDLNVYRALDDTGSGGNQLAWLQQVLNTVLQMPPPDTAAKLDCVTLLLDMNHHIVAPRLGDIWTCAWLMLDKAVAPAIQESQDKLLCSLLETYAKLRQVDTLLLAMLDAVLRNQDQLSVSKTFPPVTLQRWCELVQDLPVGLAMDIWHRMLNKLQEQCRPGAEKPHLECTPACLEQMTTVLCLFLLHLRLWDVNMTSPMATRVEQLMTSTCTTVISPLFKLCLQTKQMDEHLHFAALHLCHTWCQLQMLSTYLQGSKHSCETVPGLGVSEEWWDFSLQYPDMSPEDWSVLWHKLLKTDSKRIRYVLEMLCLQKVKMLGMLASSFEQDTVRRRVQTAINFATEIHASDGDGESWDGQATSVTSDNYPTAHWYLVCSHIGLIAPRCTQDQLVPLAHYLLQTLVSEKSCSQTAGCVTRAMISEHLLQSPAYLELLPMQEAMITAVSRGLADTVKSSKKTAVVRLFVKTLQEISNETVKNTSQMWKSVKLSAAALQDLQKEVETNLTKDLSEEQLQNIMQCCKVLKQLPLECLSDVSSARCIISSLAVDCLITSLPNMSDCAADVKRANLAVLRDVMVGQKKTSLWQSLDAAVTMKGLFISISRRSFNQLEEVSLDTALKDIYQDLMYNLLWSVVRSAEGTSALPTYTAHLCEALQRLLEPYAPQNWCLLDGLFISAGCTMSAGLMVMQNKLKVPAAQGEIIASCTRKLATTVAGLIERITSCQQPWVELPAVMTAMSAALRVQMADAQVDEDWTPLIQQKISWLEHLLTLMQDNVQKIQSCLSFLKTVAGGVPKWKAILPDKFESTVYSLVERVLLWVYPISTEEPSGSASPKDLKDVAAEAEALLLIVCRSSQPEQFSTYIQGLQKHLDCHTTVCAGLQLWQLVLKEEWKDEKKDTLNKILPQLLLQVQGILQKSSSTVTEEVLKDVVIPGLLTTAALLQAGQETLPDHVAGAALHGCLSVPLESQPGSCFAATFSAVCRVVTSLTIHHTMVARNAIPSLMACCRTLLVALVHKGRQDKECTGTVDPADVVLCAGDFERLVSALLQKVDLTRTAAFLVAEYVSELQHGTLHPEVKKSLVPSVYLLLDVCGTHGSKLLATALDPGLREIYKTLHTDYDRYHKYRGKI